MKSSTELPHRAQAEKPGKTPAGFFTTSNKNAILKTPLRTTRLTMVLARELLQYIKINGKKI
jgi:hypothetical protein